MTIATRFSASFIGLAALVVVYSTEWSGANAASNEACSIMSGEEVGAIVGRPFRNGAEGPTLPGAGMILCAWVAHEPIREKHDPSDPRENRTQVVVSFFVHENEQESWVSFLNFFDTPGYDSEFQNKISPRKIDGIGTPAFVSSALFVYYHQIVMSIRFQPYLRAPRTEHFLDIEIPVAQMIMSKLR